MQRSPDVGLPVEVGASAVPLRLGAMQRCWPLSGVALLDVGCGNGAYTLAMADGFERVEAIDVTASYLASFRERLDGAHAGRVHVRELDVTALDYPAETFDVVTMIEVLEHVDDVRVALRRIEQALKPGGALVLTVPNRLHPFETHALLVRGRYVEPRRYPFLPWVPPLHRRFATARTYTLRSLRRTVETASHLRLVSHTYVMPPFDHWAFGRRFVKPMTTRLERTPARVLGVSIVAAFVKPGNP
jgi:ubiquinone/menaquinone biosynthesis C-methylase UbiE